MFRFVLISAAVIILISMLRTHCFFKALFLSAIQGLVGLFAVNFIGGFIGVHIPFNIFSGIVGAAGGVPGIIFLLIAEILL